MNIRDFLNERYDLIAKYYLAGRLNGDLVPEIDCVQLPTNIESPKTHHWQVEYQEYIKKLVQLVKSNPKKLNSDYYVVTKWHSINHDLQEYFRKSFEEYSLHIANVLRKIIDENCYNLKIMIKKLIELYVSEYSGMYRFTSSVLESLSTPFKRRSIAMGTVLGRVAEILRIDKPRKFGPNMHDLNNLVAEYVWKDDQWLHSLQDNLFHFLITVSQVYSFPIQWKSIPVTPIRAFTTI